MREITSVVLLIISIHWLSAQPQKVDYESLRRDLILQLEVDKNDSAQASLYNAIAKTYTRQNQDSAVYYYRKAVALFMKEKEWLATSNSLCFKSMTFAIYGQLDSAKSNFLKAAEICESYQLDSALNQVYFGLGNVLESMGDLSGSLEYYLKALKYFENTGNEKSINMTKANMAYIYMKTKDLSKARSLTLESNEFYKRIDHKRLLMNGYARLATIANLENQIDTAQHYLELAIALDQELEDKMSIVEHRILLGDALLKKGELIPARSNFEMSLILLNDGVTNAGFKLEACSKLMYIESLLGKKSSTRMYQKEALQLLDEVEEATYIRGYYQLAYKTDSVDNQMTSALKNYQRFISLNDSLFNVEKSRQLTELQTQYETEKKDYEIASLTQQASLNRLELKQQRTISYGIGMVATLMIMIGFLYYRQEKIRKEKGYLAMEQKLLRTQMNPHFIFNSMGAIQHYLYQNDTQEAGKYMGMFSTLMRQILDHSRAEFIGLKDEISTLTNYMELQKLRFEDKFSYEIEVDEELDETYSAVPPMFAQPFIENALEHGLFKSERDNHIKVRFYAVSDQLIGLEIVDTGTGLIHKSITDGHQSHATKITQERLATFRKSLQQKTELAIENIKDATGQVSGLRVNLTLPTTIKLPS